MTRDGLFERSERLGASAQQRTNVRELAMTVEPQRASRKDCVELGFSLLAVAGRDARGIETEVDLRIVGREPQCPFEELDGRWACFECDPSMAMRDSGIGGREARSVSERLQRVGMLVERALQKAFPLRQAGI